MHLSGHLHVVIKERAHKCNPYFDPIGISDLKKEFESIAKVLKVHAAVEVQQLLALVALLLLLAT